jgi:hypothetical protein
MLNLIQIIINIMTLGWEPNIHMELCNTSLKKKFNPSLTMIVQDGTLQHLPLWKHVVTRIPLK